MSNRSDSVFQLSLTEIAFTVAFMLLILLGAVVVNEQAQRKDAEAALKSAQGRDQQIAALREAKESLAQAVKDAGLRNPDELVSRMVDATMARQETERLRTVVRDLDAQLTALTEVKAQLVASAQAARPEVTKVHAETALATHDRVAKAHKDSTTTLVASPRNASDWLDGAISLDSEARKQLGGYTKESARQIVSDAKAYRELNRQEGTVADPRKENADLRGQVAFLRNKLARGGLDHPPCWADESGKVEFLFNIDMKEGTFAIAPAWPPGREKDAKALPGIADLVSGQLVPAGDFARRVQAIFEGSRKSDPQCRHYVQIRSLIADAVQSDRARLLVENFFYKSEVRR